MIRKQQLKSLKSRLRLLKEQKEYLAYCSYHHINISDTDKRDIIDNQRNIKVLLKELKNVDTGNIKSFDRQR